jgi:hypothetical protein
MWSWTSLVALVGLVEVVVGALMVLDALERRFESRRLDPRTAPPLPVARANRLPNGVHRAKRSDVVSAEHRHAARSKAGKGDDS